MTKKMSLLLFNAYLPIILWAGLIFLLSNQPSLPGPNLFFWDFVFKKCAHMFVYFVLFLLTFRAFHLHKIPILHASLLAILFTAVYALSDEFHQTLIPGRTGTYRDFGYDMLGASIGWLWIHRYI